ncbi:hypothetical protein COE35_15355 [Priestia megaterium]|nr:hypothetical protein COE35_15355 [Priestia megaterium]
MYNFVKKGVLTQIAASSLIGQFRKNTEKLSIGLIEANLTQRNIQMNKFNELPKSIKKTIRYINQDASISDLKIIEQLIGLAIDKRKKEIFKQMS